MHNPVSNIPKTSLLASTADDRLDTLRLLHIPNKKPEVDTRLYESSISCHSRTLAQKAAMPSDAPWLVLYDVPAGPCAPK